MRRRRSKVHPPSGGNERQSQQLTMKGFDKICGSQTVHEAGEIQRQTRQHPKLIDLLGVQQICTDANKMDCGAAGYKQARATESSPMRRLATARQTALDAEIHGSAIHVLHQGERCWSPFSGVRLRTRRREQDGLRHCRLQAGQLR